MKEREQFKSRIGFLLLSAGCAISIGVIFHKDYKIVPIKNQHEKNRKITENNVKYGYFYEI